VPHVHPAQPLPLPQTWRHVRHHQPYWRSNCPQHWRPLHSFARTFARSIAPLSTGPSTKRHDMPPSHRARNDIRRRQSSRSNSRRPSPQSGKRLDQRLRRVLIEHDHRIHADSPTGLARAEFFTLTGRIGPLSRLTDALSFIPRSAARTRLGLSSTRRCRMSMSTKPFVKPTVRLVSPPPRPGRPIAQRHRSPHCAVPICSAVFNSFATPSRPGFADGDPGCGDGHFQPPRPAPLRPAQRQRRDALIAAPDTS